jgi:hypothetical protein
VLSSPRSETTAQSSPRRHRQNKNDETMATSASLVPPRVSYFYPENPHTRKENELPHRRGQLFLEEPQLAPILSMPVEAGSPLISQWKSLGKAIIEQFHSQGFHWRALELCRRTQVWGEPTAHATTILVALAETRTQPGEEVMEEMAKHIVALCGRS